MSKEKTYFEAEDLANFGKIGEWQEPMGKKFFDYYGEVMKEGALTVRLNGEDIGVTCFSLYGGLQVPGINLVLGTVFLNGGSHGIFAHETSTQKRKLHP